MATVAKKFKKDLTKDSTPKEYRVTVVLRTDNANTYASPGTNAKQVGEDLANTYLWSDHGYLIQTIEVEDITSA